MIRMKSVGKILLFVFVILCIFLLKPRQDVVFEAIDISQYIRLYEKDRDFVLCIDENALFTGTYSILADTVFLSYREQMESSLTPTNFKRTNKNQHLPQKLYIDDSASTIESKNGQLFSAEISLDLREMPDESRAFSPSEKNKHQAQILAFGD